MHAVEEATQAPVGPSPSAEATATHEGEKGHLREQKTSSLSGKKIKRRR